MSNRKKIWGWFFYDWASQPFHTLLMTFVFGPYFAIVASQYYLGLGQDETLADANAQIVWSNCLAITGLIIGFGGPVLGAIADTTRLRKPWISTFSVIYLVTALALWFTLPDGSNMLLMLSVFGLCFIMAEYTYIFTNAQLPSLGSIDEVGKISGSGFGFGYAGGVLSLLIMLLFFVEQDNGKTMILEMDPLFGLDASQKEGTRFVGPFVAIWFAIFMIPYFAWVREDKSLRQKLNISEGLANLIGSIKSLPSRKSLFSYLVASMFYRDALNGLYTFGGTYAVLVLNWNIVKLGQFGIIAAVSAALFSWLGGFLDRRVGPKPVIVVMVCILTVVCFVIVNTSLTHVFGVAVPEGSNLPDMVFYTCGVFIGGMGGILQSASRSMMVRHTRPEKATEGFGLYALSGRATAFLAPALIGIVTAISGDARIGISPLVGLFIVGLVLLLWVHPKGEYDNSEA
ncbi:MAG: MFS transporter [Paracoccaceae bacterium]|jgi:UMF1 family MFS transporter|tara:strand:+ start:356 stop:1726 length:1371 start_codon:yes stop_codon:yes gene_type:complete